MGGLFEMWEMGVELHVGRADGEGLYVVRRVIGR